MRYIYVIIAVFLIAGCACASDIVTMPTANQLKAGTVEAAAYYISLDGPSSVQYQTVYVGITDKIELDAHRTDVDGDKTSTILVASYKALSENAVMPDVVVGIRNLTGASTTNAFRAGGLDDKSEDRSYFVTAAKTLSLSPAIPFVKSLRLNLGLGTADYTLFGDKRHDGIFGGAQIGLSADMGAVLQYDGESWITGLTFSPKSVSGLTVKAGTYGEDNWWVGAAMSKPIAF